MKGLIAQIAGTVIAGFAFYLWKEDAQGALFVACCFSCLASLLIAVKQ